MTTTQYWQPATWHSKPFSALTSGHGSSPLTTSTVRFRSTTTVGASASMHMTTITTTGTTECLGDGTAIAEVISSAECTHTMVMALTSAAVISENTDVADILDLVAVTVAAASEMVAVEVTDRAETSEMVAEAETDQAETIETVVAVETDQADTTTTAETDRVETAMVTTTVEGTGQAETVVETTMAVGTGQAETVVETTMAVETVQAETTTWVEAITAAT